MFYLLNFAFCTLSDMSRENVIKLMVEKFKIKLPLQSIPENSETRQVSTSGILSNLIGKHIQCSKNLQTINAELKKFREVTVATDNVLDFWKKNEHIFSNLSSVARVLMALPLTTAKSEGAFSIAGSLIRDKRASITPTRVEKVLFIHDNFDFAK